MVEKTILKWLSKIPAIRREKQRRLDLTAAVDTLHSRMDVGDELFDLYHAAKVTSDYQMAFQKRDPLVSVCVCTFNRGELLVSRCIRSLLNQEYKNIEIIIVGDHCTDDTEKLVTAIRDSRLRFKNLATRSVYPSDPEARWMVAGTIPMNESLKMATGDFITHLDDDDEHSPERIGRLLEFARSKMADFVYHPFWYELPSGRWRLNPAESLQKSSVTTSSSFYHRWFARIPWDMKAYRYGEPGDWNRFRKFKYLRASSARYPQPLLVHYKERNQSPYK